MPIDASCRAFMEFSRTKGFEVVVLSDGSEYCVRELDDSGPPEETGFFAACTDRANCRRNIMLTRSSEEDVIIYVGEGPPDFCPVRYADIVFAKSLLQTYCQQNNISYYPYHNLGDVADRLEQLTTGGNQIRQRRRAEMERREAFKNE